MSQIATVTKSVADRNVIHLCACVFPFIFNSPSDRLTLNRLFDRRAADPTARSSETNIAAAFNGPARVRDASNKSEKELETIDAVGGNSVNVTDAIRVPTMKIYYIFVVVASLIEPHAHLLVNEWKSALTMAPLCVVHLYAKCSIRVHATNTKSCANYRPSSSLSTAAVVVTAAASENAEQEEAYAPFADRGINVSTNIVLNTTNGTRPMEKAIFLNKFKWKARACEWEREGANLRLKAHSMNRQSKRRDKAATIRNLMSRQPSSRRRSPSIVVGVNCEVHSCSVPRLQPLTHNRSINKFVWDALIAILWKIFAANGFTALEVGTHQTRTTFNNIKLITQIYCPRKKKKKIRNGK